MVVDHLLNLDDCRSLLRRKRPPHPLPVLPMDGGWLAPLATMVYVELFRTNHPCICEWLLGLGNSIRRDERSNVSNRENSQIWLGIANWFSAFIFHFYSDRLQLGSTCLNIHANRTDRRSLCSPACSAPTLVCMECC